MDNQSFLWRKASLDSLALFAVFFTSFHCINTFSTFSQIISETLGLAIKLFIPLICKKMSRPKNPGRKICGRKITESCILPKPIFEEVTLFKLKSNHLTPPFPSLNLLFPYITCHRWEKKLKYTFRTQNGSLNKGTSSHCYALYLSFWTKKSYINELYARELTLIQIQSRRLLLPIVHIHSSNQYRSIAWLANVFCKEELSI